MALDSVVVYCGGCQARLEEDDPHASAEQRCPCPHCGSILRHFEANMSGTLTFHSKFTGKGCHSGEKRPFIEQAVGDDLHRKTGRWMQLHRLIDRTKKWYHERVTDPATGTVVHECDEPLPEHRGHGSAKPDHRKRTKVSE